MEILDEMNEEQEKIRMEARKLESLESEDDGSLNDS